MGKQPVQDPNSMGPSIPSNPKDRSCPDVMLFVDEPLQNWVKLLSQTLLQYIVRVKTRNTATRRLGLVPRTLPKTARTSKDSRQ